MYKPLCTCSEDGKYHGCWTVYEDRTRKFISKGRECYFATNDPFWKDPKGVDFKIKTRAKKKQKNTPIAKQKDVIEYLTIEVDENQDPVDMLKLTDEK